MRSDVAHFELRCPYCDRKVSAVVCRVEATPHAGDFAVCPCGGVGVLRDRNMFGRRWFIARPTKTESYRIAQHDGVQVILGGLQ